MARLAGEGLRTVAPTAMSGGSNWTRCPSALLACPHVTAEDLRVLLYVAWRQGRNPTGYPRYETIAAGADVSRRTAVRSVKRLAALGLLRVERGGAPRGGERKPNHYSVDWGHLDQCRADTGTSEDDPCPTDTGVSQVPVSPRHPDQCLPGTLTSVPLAPELDTGNQIQGTRATEVSNYLAEAIASHSPNAKLKPRTWDQDVDLAIRVDGRTPEALTEVIDFAHASSDTFWRDKILSGRKLREKYDRLAIQAKRTRTPGSVAGRVNAAAATESLARRPVEAILRERELAATEARRSAKPVSADAVEVLERWLPSHARAGGSDV